MMTRYSLRAVQRATIFGAIALALPLSLAGCPKKETPIVDAGPPPPPVPVVPSSAPTMTELVPLADDAGADADAAEAATEPPKKHAAPTLATVNVARIKVCCNAMREQAKQLGPSSPEGYQLNTMAQQCDAFAAQVGPSGTAPELSQFREILKTLKLPSACQL